MTHFSRRIYSWTCFIRCKKNFDHISYGSHSRAKWSLGSRFQNLAPRRRRGAKFEVAPRRHFLWNLKGEYLKKERSCGAKTSMANRYYNVCYAESIVFMFHQLLRFTITKQIFLHWRRVAPPSGATQCLEGQIKSRPYSPPIFYTLREISEKVW